ncbi:MAG: MATE family efflux transporter, partial [Clostridiales bacterium]|nr:MATE family efflux transporter [Clostridiales bacterium]
MNVRGAALATIISQGISAIWVMKFILGKETILKLEKKNFKIDKGIMSKTIQLGMSPFVMNVTESFIMIAFNTSLLKFVGDAAVGAMTILSSCMMIVFLPLSGLTQGSQPIMSYNFGARNRERVKESFKILLISCFGYATTMFV